MPEEINRILIDNISDYLFAPDNNAFKNLVDIESINQRKVFLVGNTSVDARLRAMHMFKVETLNKYSLEKEKYILFTIHRQENTTPEVLKEIIMALSKYRKK